MSENFDPDFDSGFNINYDLVMHRLPPKLRQKILFPPSDPIEKTQNEYDVIKDLIRRKFSDDQINNIMLRFDIGKEEKDKGSDFSKNIRRSRNAKLGESTIAEQFANSNSNFRFCSSWGKWLIWDEKLGYWQIDEGTKINNAISKLLKDLEITDLRRSYRLINGVEILTQSQDNIETKDKDWDSNHYLITTPNGTVDLKTSKLRPTYKDDLITKITTVSPKKIENNPPKLWLKFLHEATLNDSEFIDYLQRMAGYFLTGSIKEELLFFIYGDGGNGKGVFIDTLRGILGDYETVATMSMFAQNKYDSHTTDLAMLRGARLVTAQETEEGKFWNESRIKSMTGGDAITARFMRQDNFTFTPNFKLLFAGNNKPNLKSVDDAHKRRFHIIPFVHKPSDQNRDKDLKQKLKSEYEQIFQWMIEGCLKWQQIGLVQCKVVKEATDEYFSEQDKLQQWMDELCNLKPGIKTATEILFKSWESFATRSGFYPGSSISLAAKLRKVGLTPEVNIPFGKGLRGRGFIGIELKPPEPDEDLENLKKKAQNKESV